jgi:tetratricopeptide (TPR) repeat protein
MSRAIEKAIESENWKRARNLIRARLRREPRDHWLLARLGLTYYEERAYSRALRCEVRALSIQPSCPLALWDYAGSLQMLGREREALRTYKRLIRRGVRSLAYGRCGEGLARARGLVADCHYRAGLSHQELGQRRRAIKALRKHLKLRGPGCHSIYRAEDIKRELADLLKT